MLNADWMLLLMPIVVDVINSNEKLLMLMMVVTDADNKLVMVMVLLTDAPITLFAISSSPSWSSANAFLVQKMLCNHSLNRHQHHNTTFVMTLYHS